MNAVDFFLQPEQMGRKRLSGSSLTWVILASPEIPNEWIFTRLN